MVISADEYERLAARPDSSLLEFLSNTGFSELDLERTEPDYAREVEV
jgi:hypothetical protein